MPGRRVSGSAKLRSSPHTGPQWPPGAFPSEVGVCGLASPPGAAGGSSGGGAWLVLSPMTSWSSGREGASLMLAIHSSHSSRTFGASKSAPCGSLTGRAREPSEAGKRKIFPKWLDSAWLFGYIARGA